jgi:hypothetical protein
VGEASAEEIAAELRAQTAGAEIHRVIANKPIDEDVWAFLYR